MKIAIGNDHAAVEMKQEIRTYLEEKGYEVETKIRGLGECEGIRRMFYQHLKEATELE